MTYGVNAPLGLVPASYGLSAPFTGGIQVFQLNASAASSFFVGDFVQFTNGLIDVYTPGTPSPCGVFIGCSYVDSQGVYQFSKYWPQNTVLKTGTNAFANIISDTNTIFTIQANAAVVTANINKNADVTFSTPGSTASGLSGMMLNTSTIATTNTLPLHIISFDPIPGNVSGVPYNNVLVKMNNTSINSGATGQ